MSDPLKHECGIVMLRLLKPLEYYQEKYGTALYGFHKLFMLMEKQHNRGQDGAGMGCVKLSTPVGQPYMFRDRETGNKSLASIVKRQLTAYSELVNKGVIDGSNVDTIKQNWDFAGEVLVGHLRYGTSGTYGTRACHPYIRRSNWPTRNLMLAGNFTMTNSTHLTGKLEARGQHPIYDTDTQVLLETIGYQLDEAHNGIYKDLKVKGLSGQEMQSKICQELDPAQIIKEVSGDWDGGYTMCGLIGNGDSFVLRDPMGIRPGYYYQDDEIYAVTSERVPLMTVLGVDAEHVRELEPGMVTVIKRDGEIRKERFRAEEKKKHCSFERIYFSRGNDPDIYAERKALGGELAGPILKAIDGDLKNTIFSYIPNTAETAYIGLVDKLDKLRRYEVRESIAKALNDNTLREDMLDELVMNNWPRREKIAVKDAKLRTFISQEEDRLEMASHVYDVSYGVVESDVDVLVCIDDSIVRGTTLKQSILKMLGRTRPRKVIIASTAPQIRYPDCYGIDMSEIGKFVAFQAAVELLKQDGKESVLKEVYEACKDCEVGVNPVKEIYKSFTDRELSAQIAKIVCPEGLGLEVIYQSIEGLHKCLREECGDWYFTGNYPTNGGFEAVRKSYMNYYEGNLGRSY